MVKESEIQTRLIEQLKKLPSLELPLVDELGELLELSPDSTYRRIRGESQFSITEIERVCRHFSISFDALMETDENKVYFDYVSLEDKSFDLEAYFKILIQDLTEISKGEKKRVVYLAKDIPITHLFTMPEIAAFKTFFWMKTIAGFPHLEEAKFSLDDIDTKVTDTASNILPLIMQIPFVEVWTQETILSILSQIRYYWDVGFFGDKDDAIFLCNKLLVLIEHVEQQAINEFQFYSDGNVGGVKGNYELYINDLVLPDNTILTEADEQKSVYISHNVMNYLKTSNTYFCDGTLRTIDNIIRRSTLISGVAERERSKFFTSLTNKINQIISDISKD